MVCQRASQVSSPTTVTHVRIGARRRPVPSALSLSPFLLHSLLSPSFFFLSSLTSSFSPSHLLSLSLTPWFCSLALLLSPFPSSSFFLLLSLPPSAGLHNILLVVKTKLRWVCYLKIWLANDVLLFASALRRDPGEHGEPVRSCVCPWTHSCHEYIFWGFSCIALIRL